MRLDAADPFARTQALAPGQIFDPTQPDSVSGPTKNSLTRYQFGGTAGFPIKKDKTFLFVSFEGLLQDAQNSVPILTNTRYFPADCAHKMRLSLDWRRKGNAPVTCLAVLSVQVAAHYLHLFALAHSASGLTVQPMLTGA